MDSLTNFYYKDLTAYSESREYMRRYYTSTPHRGSSEILTKMKLIKSMPLN